MMMRSLLMLSLVGSTLGAGVADAAYFEVNLAGSSVTLTDQSGGGRICSLTACGIEANLASGLGGNITLDDGDTWDLDFIEFTANGTTGLSPRIFDITATLAFTNPSGIDTTSTGHGGGFFISGVITGGVLHWNAIPAVYSLADGSRVEVAFQDGISLLPLTRSVVTTASVDYRAGIVSASAVPEPGAAILFAAGISVVALRKRFVQGEIAPGH